MLLRNLLSSLVTVESIEVGIPFRQSVLYRILVQWCTQSQLRGLEVRIFEPLLRTMTLRISTFAFVFIA